MTTNKFTRGLGAVALLAMFGCQSLDVGNPNEPDANDALSNPEAIAALTAGAFQTWFNAYTDLRGAGVQSVQARTYSSSWNNGNLNYHQGIYDAGGNRINPADTTIDPLTWTRNGGAYDNNPSAAARTTIDAFWGGGLDESAISRPGFYASLASANTALDAIRNNDLVITDAAETARIEAAAAFMQGASFMVLALTYDKAYIVDENSTPGNSAEVAALQYSHRSVVRDTAVLKLVQAAQLAAAAAAADPAAATDAGWTNGNSYSYGDLSKIAYTMAAMTLAYYPRDDAEVADVDWNAVVSYASQGMSSGGSQIDFHAVGDGYTAWISELMYWFDGIDSGRLHTRVAHFMDPATQVDPYRLGVGSPQPNSPDHRMGDGSFADADAQASFSTTPLTANGGTDMAWMEGGEVMRPDRGFYAQSNIGHVRYDASRNQDPNDVYGGYGEMPAITWYQNELIWAEGLLRRNGAGDALAATAHINSSRVGRGGLSSSAVFVANIGTPADGPCMANNRLAKDGGACSLWSALLYENEIELLGLGPAPFWNQRHLPNVAATAWEQIGSTIYNGPRFIQGLLPGTPREMPVPYKELGVKGEALYTWGGLGPANSPTP